MPDTVTVVLDAKQYYEEIARITSRTNGLARAGEGIGGGFLKGERAVRVATANITQGLFMANNAADATLITMQSLERVFRIPIGMTIFAAAAIAAGEAITRTIEAAAKLNEEVRKLSSFARLGGSADFLGTDKIQSNLDAIISKVNELSGTVITRSRSLAAFLTGAGGIGPLSGIIPAQNAADQERIHELQMGAAEDVDALMIKQNELNRVKLEELDGNQQLVELDKLRIDHNERLGKLAKDVVAAGLAGTDAARLLLSVENDRYNIAVKLLQKKEQEAKLDIAVARAAAEKRTAEAASNFFADVGSGRFLANIEQERARQLQEQAGRDIIEQFNSDRAAGRALGPNAQTALRAADALARSAGTSISDLVKADFSNLLTLSKYDFSGLAPLSNLTIRIQ